MHDGDFQAYFRGYRSRYSLRFSVTGVLRIVPADAGMETVRLNLAFAFYSAQVGLILTEFKQAASQGVAYHPPTIPVLSPLLGRGSTCR